MAEFNLIGFQDGLIAEFERIESTGVGDHKLRSRGAVRRKAEAKLRAVGFNEVEAVQIVRDALDVFKLNLGAEEI